MTTPSEDQSKMPQWGLPAFSWLLSFYFLAGFICNAGFPPARTLFTGDLVFVALWLFFLFLPFYSKVKIGGILELEREVAKAKEELREFKAEIRNSMSVLSTNVNTIGGMSNQVTFNIPGLLELYEARKTVAEKAPRMSRQDAKVVENEFLLESEDTTIALARTRIEIERLLRNRLGKRTTTNLDKEEAIKFMGTRQLFELFVRQNDQYSYLSKPFLYVTQVCNAAIHAQRVSDEQAREALGLGAQIIAALKSATSSEDEPD